MTNTNYPLTLLYDGACPLCKLEMDNLRERNHQGLLLFVDISAPGFDVAPYTRVHASTLAHMQALIHAMRPNGELVVGTAVFRLAYGAVGLGRWVAPTGWPLLNVFFELAYALFARHRYAVSRWCMPLISRMAARRALRRTHACEGGHCATHPVSQPTLGDH